MANQSITAPRIHTYDFTASSSEEELWADPATVVIRPPQRSHVHPIHAVTMISPPLVAPSSFRPYAVTLMPPPMLPPPPTMTYGRRDTPTFRSTSPGLTTSHDRLVAILLCGAFALVAALTASISYATKHRGTTASASSISTASAPATARTTARVAVVEAAPVLINSGSRAAKTAQIDAMLEEDTPQSRLSAHHTHTPSSLQ
jgi:hypothetical protein